MSAKIKKETETKKEDSQRRSQTAATVRVEVIGQGLYENGAVHTKGQRFETTPERAAGLSALVRVVEG